MKKINSILLATACFLLITFPLKAQTFSEWFRQNKTQIKYLIDQIAAYTILQNDLAEGYHIAGSGLTYIGDTTRGELDLHSNYINSLSVVSPVVAGYSRISDIVSYQGGITSSFKKILQATNMNASDMACIDSVYIHITGECTRSVSDLIDILTDKRFSMKDDERISRIDAIYADMKDRYAFAQSFSSQALLLAAQRQSDASDVTESMINHGLK